MHALQVLASLSYLAPLRRAVVVQPRATPVARAAGVMQQIPGIGSKSKSTTAVPVSISTTGFNSRCISASLVVGAPPEAVWAILTDYDNLATHVPNLVTSELRPHPNGGIRLFQEGAQKIVGAQEIVGVYSRRWDTTTTDPLKLLLAWPKQDPLPGTYPRVPASSLPVCFDRYGPSPLFPGFDFRASLLMDMDECKGGDNEARGMRRIDFKLVESMMFAAFEGEWRVQPFSRIRQTDDPEKFEYTTKLSYKVDITPKGLVPVPALQWRIREDVPVNLLAVRAASERLHLQRKRAQQR